MEGVSKIWRCASRNGHWGLSHYCCQSFAKPFSLINIKQFFEPKRLPKDQKMMPLPYSRQVNLWNSPVGELCLILIGCHCFARRVNLKYAPVDRYIPAMILKPRIGQGTILFQTQKSWPMTRCSNRYSNNFEEKRALRIRLFMGVKVYDLAQI